jgi:hypothetical protein
MVPREALKMYLFGHPSSKAIKVTSCFKAAARDARKATRRQKNGNKKSGVNHGRWLGAIGYMSLLDQIGGCIKPTGKKTKYTNEIKKALDYFDSGLNDDEINALYALRCSFTHNYSLINIDSNFKGINKSKDKLTHCFHVGVGNTGKVVELPLEKWDRDFSNISSNNITYIDLEAFGDLVEEICQKVIEKYRENKLELSLPVEEFMGKYFLHTKKKEI